MMKYSRSARLILGIASLLFGIEVILFWEFIFLFGGIGLIILAVALIANSDEYWKKSMKEAFPFRIENLFRFPRLPYFQTAIMVFYLIGAIFSILPSAYSGFMLVLIGLAISQIVLNISEKNIKSEPKIMIALQFQTFIFFSTFVYENFQTSYLLSLGPEYLASVFLFFAWFFEFIYLYMRIFK